MKWIFAAAVILVIGLLAIKASDWLPAEEIRIDEYISVIVNPVQATASANKVIARLDTDLAPEHLAKAVQAEATQWSSALCLEGRGCTLDLHDNWHLELMSKDGGLRSVELEALFKSRNFIEAAEQLHYSRQKAEDHKAELKLAQLMSIAEQRFQAEPKALGCRDNLCLLQITVPRDIKVDDVRKMLFDPDLSWRTLFMSKQKSKYNWSLRFVAIVDEKAVLSEP